jgi:predicted anti-sigma-YlaC factor YlaD
MSLRCEEVRERFSALWESELSPSEQAEVKNHLELCPDCQKEYSRFDKTLRMLHSVEEQEVPGGFLPGIYEKIEERGRKGIPPEKASWRWLHLPLRLKLPMQALAMVAIVFLALYLTKMTPSELTRTKEVGESKPSSF